MHVYSTLIAGIIAGLTSAKKCQRMDGKKRKCKKDPLCSWKPDDSQPSGDCVFTEFKGKKGKLRRALDKLLDTGENTEFKGKKGKKKMRRLIAKLLNTGERKMRNVIDNLLDTEDDDDEPKSGGVLACETKKLNKIECEIIGCCEWEDKECFSAVESDPCVNEPKTGGVLACENNNLNKINCEHMGCCNWDKGGKECLSAVESDPCVNEEPVYCDPAYPDNTVPEDCAPVCITKSDTKGFYCSDCTGYTKSENDGHFDKNENEDAPQCFCGGCVLLYNVAPDMDGNYPDDAISCLGVPGNGVNCCADDAPYALCHSFCDGFCI